MSVNVLYTTSATSYGGRDGRAVMKTVAWKSSCPPRASWAVLAVQGTIPSNCSRLVIRLASSAP